MNIAKSILVMSLLASCSHMMKYEHQIEAAFEALESEEGEKIIT